MKERLALLALPILLAACAGAGPCASGDVQCPSQDAAASSCPDQLSATEVPDPVELPEIDEFEARAFVPAPCQENGDCSSGWCVLHLGELACTNLCDEAECLSGFECREVEGAPSGPELLCVSLHPKPCFPCDTDEQCEALPGEPARCVKFGADVGSFCGTKCSVEVPCPAAYSCQMAVTTNGQVHPLCLPEAGLCDCLPAAVKWGASTTCLQQSEYGTCTGERTCGPGGLTDCSVEPPGPEVCNGVDDDCNGNTDDYACDDGNGCTEDLCDPVAGCNNVELTGDKCIDGDNCTDDDYCEAGQCVGGQAVECPESGFTCIAYICDPEDGGCVPEPANDGVECGEGKTCLDGFCL